MNSQTLFLILVIVRVIQNKSMDFHGCSYCKHPTVSFVIHQGVINVLTSFLLRHVAENASAYPRGNGRVFAEEYGPGKFQEIKAVALQYEFFITALDTGAPSGLQV